MALRLLLVTLGGAAGTLFRYGVTEAIGTDAVWPWPTFVVNVVGSFLLGVLAARVVNVADPRRLLFGTGFLGGFTTYSAFAVETDQLLRDGAVATGLLYPTVSIVLGLCAVVAGLMVGRRHR